jgi:hypothetical protein
MIILKKARASGTPASPGVVVLAGLPVIHDDHGCTVAGSTPLYSHSIILRERNA